MSLLGVAQRCGGSAITVICIKLELLKKPLKERGVVIAQDLEKTASIRPQALMISRLERS